MSKSAIKKVYSIGIDLNTIITYDNFNFIEG